MLAGLAFIADILFVLTAPETEWTNVAYIVAALLLVVGMVGLHTLQKGNYGRIGRGGFWTVVVSSLAQVVGLMVFLLGSEVLIWLVFPVGFLVVAVGLILYGAATLQARVLPRWCELGLIIVPPVTVFFGDYGGILFGLLWLALGYVLWSRREVSAQRPSRVS
jgi:hypothetical protein